MGIAIDHHQKNNQLRKNPKVMTHINLSIVQHNVLKWKTHRIDLINVYNEINPDVILINSHGNKSNEKIKIFNYVTYQSNMLEERNSFIQISLA